jgi:hypothetical protein
MRIDPEKRRRKELVARWKAKQRAASRPTCDVPDARMRDCPRCGEKLTFNSSWDLCGEDGCSAVWFASCTACQAWFLSDPPPPDGEPVWRRIDDPPEFIVDWDGYLARHRLN